MTTFWLSTHVPYACRHSGVCCSSRWPIPIERERATAVQLTLHSGALTPSPQPWLRPVPDAPPDTAGVLALQASGACVFHQSWSVRDRAAVPGGCRIHAVRPASCEHFPFVCVVDPRGVHVTLSHYCPSAADLLFTDAAPVSVVAGPAVLEDGRVPEGLDAREALPPLAAGGARARVGRRPRLMDWDEVTAWERALVAALTADRTEPHPPDLRLFAGAVDAVPAGLSWPAPIDDTRDVWLDRIAPQWGRWAAIVGRYLAARAYGSWAMCLGSGPEDVLRAVTVARTVLQVEVVRQCAGHAEPLDRAQLKQAIRQSDLLLLHYADPDRWWRAATPGDSAGALV